MQDPVGVLLVAAGIAAVPLVLLVLADQHLVEQRVAQPRDLDPRPRLRALAVGVAPNLHLAPAGAGPDPDRGVGGGDVLRDAAVSRQLRDRDLQRDRVHVGPALERVDPRRGGDHRAQMQVLKRPQVGEVEDRAQIGEEAVVALTGEHRDAALDRVDRLRHQRGIVRRRARPDVARRRSQVATDHLGNRLRVGPAGPVGDLLLALQQRDRIGLTAVERGIPDRRDRAGVVQERLAVDDVVGEVELIGDVRHAGAVVADVDEVADVGPELIEVGSGRGRLERNVIRDDRHRVRAIGTDERVRVGVVGDRILADLRRFAM